MQGRSQERLGEEKSLSLYFREIRPFEVLSLSEEVELFQRLKDPDTTDFEREKIKEKIILANQRFVVHIAKKIYRPSSALSLGDFISEGNLGLHEALHRYDETKGFRFISYAVWWIYQAMYKLLQEKSFIRKPHYYKEKEKKLLQKRKDKELEFKDSPFTLESTKEYYELEKEIQNLESDNQILYPVSLSESIISEKNPSSRTREDVLPCPQKNPEEMCIEKDLVHNIYCLIEEKIPTLRGQRILKKYYGIGELGEMSMKGIAESENITRDKVRQILKQGMGYLKKEVGDLGRERV